VRAASYGHTLGGAVGLAMIEPGTRPALGLPQPVAVDAAYLESGCWEVEIARERFPAKVSMRPLYDPTMVRIKS